MAKELTASPSSKPRAVILGGGLAGMSAACHLLDEGWGVTLVEKRPYLGGRAFSFTDRETGQVVDNGQHVFLGCCTYYMDFLEKIGTLQRAYLQDRTRVDVVSPAGPSSSIAAGRLPKPLHMLPSFLSYKHLGVWDKLTASLLPPAPERHRPQQALPPGRDLWPLAPSPPTDQTHHRKLLEPHRQALRQRRR